jgi:sugar phosphate isomerase/epimerase
MAVKRFLGAAWASVRGPADPNRLLTWVLEHRFAGLLAGPAPRALDWAGLAAGARDLPVRFAAVRVGSVFAERLVTAGLASSQEGERQVAMQAVQQAVGIARTLNCPQVVLEPGLVPVLGEIEAEDLGEANYRWTPERAQALLARRKVGRNPALDRACRAVHTLARAFPEIRFSLTAGRSLRAVADREALLDLFADLHQLELGYWHDAAVAARREQVLGEPQGEWLESFGNRLSGMTLGDASPDGMYLPPGAGGVDYGLCRSYLPQAGAALPVALELDPAVPSGELPGMLACLDKHGL